jgi:hypothetical protein
MGRNITSVANNNSFEQWVDVTNQLANALSETLTVSLTANGDLVTGNSQVNGVFGSTTLAANTIRGGTVNTSANLTISSNVNFTGANTNLNSTNINITGANTNLNSNSTVTVVSIKNDGTGTNSILGGNNITITANLVINGKFFNVPAGNTGNRPAGSNGAIRYNSELGALEYYNSTEWLTIAASDGGVVIANTVSFTPNANVVSNNVQNAIIEVFNDKLSKEGDTATGKITFNINGGTVPTAPSGTIIHLLQSDANPAVITSEAFSTLNTFIAKRSEGSLGTKLAISNNSTILSLIGSGYDGNSYGNNASINILATQVWTNTAHGSSITFRATPNGSITETTVLTITANLSSFSSNVSVTGTLSANILSGNGSTITSLHGNNITTGTIATGRLELPVSSESTSGIIAIANTSEFRSNSTGAKSLSPNTVWTSAAIVSLTDAATIALDFATFINGEVTLGANRILGAPSNAKTGQSGFIKINQDGTGSRTLTFNSVWKFSRGSIPVLTTNANATDLLFYQVANSTFILGSLVENVK